MAKSKKSAGKSKSQPASNTVSFNPIPSMQRTIDIFQQPSAIRSAIRDAERDKQEQKIILETAKRVDELVSDSTTMQHWRNKVALTFRRPEVSNVKDNRDVYGVWQKWLVNFNPATHIDVLYTLLAFCHDDRLCMNLIVTDELKAQSPLLCQQMTVYLIRGIPKLLDVYLSQVEKDLNNTEGDTKLKSENTHSADFTSVIWNGKKYQFNKTQAECVKLLWEEYEKGTYTLSEKTIGEAIDSAADNFRLLYVFRNHKGKSKSMHPAWGEMIIKYGKGTYGFAVNSKKKSKSQKNHTLRTT